ncbi:MAG: Spy/CpxP family protein refolding chaperone [Pseudomonadota bacterium]|nr:Spy/CpxP family protein refolding chaperone [Pseudomonadota bacterium]
MWKAALAGALLATIGSSLAMAENQFPALTQVSESSGMAESHIAHFKAALRLSAEQERHWPRVAAALRQIVQSYNSDELSSGGLVRRIGTRASNVLLNANAIRLLVAAAQPLMKSLDQEQKQHALVLARNMGFGGAAAHFE